MDRKKQTNKKKKNKETYTHIQKTKKSTEKKKEKKINKGVI